MDGLTLRALPPYVVPDGAVDTYHALAARGMTFPDYTRAANAIELAVEPQPEVVQLQCCWNGIVVITAAPFYAGLAFRSNLPGECGASECSHFCRDMAGLGIVCVATYHGVRVAYENGTQHRAKALDVPYEAVQLPLAFDRPSYARDTNEPDAAFAYRVWMMVTEEPVAGGFADFLATVSAGKAEVRPTELVPFLTDEPRASCRMAPAATVAQTPCLAPAGRFIPRRLTQVGAADARDALTPCTRTWRRLHPDHEYEFVDASGGEGGGGRGGGGGLPASVVALVPALLAAGANHTALAADLARYALLFDRGGIVADLGSTSGESLSCVLAAGDALVEAFVRGGGVHPVALVAMPGHAAVRSRLDELLVSAERVLQGGDGGGGDPPALDGPPQRVELDARFLDMPSWWPGQGARVRHRVDGSGLGRGLGELF